MPNQDCSEEASSAAKPQYYSEAVRGQKAAEEVCLY
jgi:hypothetical protein